MSQKKKYASQILNDNLEKDKVSAFNTHLDEKKKKNRREY